MSNDKEDFAPLDDETERVLWQLSQSTLNGAFGPELMDVRKRIRQLITNASGLRIIGNSSDINAIALGNLQNKIDMEGE